MLSNEVDVVAPHYKVGGLRGKEIPVRGVDEKVVRNPLLLRL